jgi:hypothetical protein
MATATRDNGASVIVADEDLMVHLADMLEKMELVEAKLMRLGQQASFPNGTDVDVSSATGRADRAQSTAHKLAMKAVEVARDAVLFCERLDNACGRPKSRRVLEH